MRLPALASAVVILTLALIRPALSDQPKTATSGEGGAIVFVPPKAGKPVDRAGAGTREIWTEGGMLDLLVPNGGGVTTMAKPPLVWRLNARFVGQVTSEFANTRNFETVVARSDTGRFRPGYYGLDLNRSDVELVPGEIYRWKVSLIDGESGAVLDQAITYIERSPIGHDAVPETDKSVADLAAEGLWLDALDRLVRIDLSGSATVLSKPDLQMLAASAGLVAE